jgi:exodeoxyribonuclease III
MKIATFNINNVNKRLPNLMAWLGEARPDVVCLQELKSTDADFPIAALRRSGYQGGVARSKRHSRPDVFRLKLSNSGSSVPSPR